MEYKSYVEIKSIGEGKVIATLATKGVIDKQRDVLVDGLISGRQIVCIKPQHRTDIVHLGVSTVYETRKTVEAELLYNLDIPAARDWYLATKFSHEHGHRFQYSFAFHPDESAPGMHEGQRVRFLKRITMLETSPVLEGASIGSHTLSVKSQDWRADMLRRIEERRRPWRWR